jgi:hypothetical protein
LFTGIVKACEVVAVCIKATLTVRLRTETNNREDCFQQNLRSAIKCTINSSTPRVALKKTAIELSL